MLFYVFEKMTYWRFSMKRLIAFVLLFLTFVFPAFASPVWTDPVQFQAVDLMRQCEAALWRAKLKSRAVIDESLDPHTGLVGPEFTALTTTLGHLSDKRAACLPEQAGAVAGYLLRAGLKRGDWIAVNASASFPGFLLATLCAAQTMGLNTLTVFSYGASMYGGTEPRFTFPLALDEMNRLGLLTMKLDAISPGGAYDRMDEVLLEDGRPLVKQLMAARPEAKIEEPTLALAIQRRQQLFNARPVKAFVNVGGPWTSMGLDDNAEILKVGHGLLKTYPVIPSGPERGLVFDFMARGVPVIHLLFARGICADWGIAYEELAEP